MLTSSSVTHTLPVSLSLSYTHRCAAADSLTLKTVPKTHKSKEKQNVSGVEAIVLYDF